MTETVAKKEDTFAKKVEMAKLGAEAVVKKVELAKHKYSSTVHCGQHCDKYFVVLFTRNNFDRIAMLALGIGDVLFLKKKR